MTKPQLQKILADCMDAQERGDERSFVLVITQDIELALIHCDEQGFFALPAGSEIVFVSDEQAPTHHRTECINASLKAHGSSLRAIGELSEYADKKVCIYRP